MSTSLEFEFPQLKEAQGKLDAKRKELADVFGEAGPDYDLDKVKSVSGSRDDKLEWIRSKNAEIDDLKKKADELWDVARAAQNAHAGHGEPGADGGHEPPTKDAVPKSLGYQFVESDAFKAYRRGSGAGPSAQLDLGDAGLKADFTTSAGWAPESTRSGVVSMFPTRPAPHVIDAIAQAPVDQAAYVYMEETTFTNNAAETAEGSAYPEGALALTERTQTVRKIPTFLPVTDEQLEDVSGARAYIDNRLTLMVRQRADGQVLTGSGSGVNLEGTENVTGIQTQALGTDPIPDAIFKLFRQIRDDGFAEPTVVFIRPAKWENVRLLKTSDGQYIWGHPAQPGPETIWGVPVVQTTAVSASKAVAGDYQQHALLAIRRGIDIQISNSHSDYFVNGKQAVRADMRAAMVHFRPKAFGNVTGL